MRYEPDARKKKGGELKLLFCEVCRDLVKPIGTFQPRLCICRRHAIWALDERAWEVRVADAQGRAGIPDTPAAYLLFISNRLLDLEGPMDGETAGALLALQGDNWFRKLNSLAVRTRPGEHPKTAWAPLPEGHTVRWGAVRTLI